MSKEYLEFQLKPREAGKKTDSWEVMSRTGDFLGFVLFHGAWRKFTFMPTAGCLFDTGCLGAIGQFLESETKKWRDGLKSKTGRKRAWNSSAATARK